MVLGVQLFCEAQTRFFAGFCSWISWTQKKKKRVGPSLENSDVLGQCVENTSGYTKNAKTLWFYHVFIHAQFISCLIHLACAGFDVKFILNGHLFSWFLLLLGSESSPQLSLQVRVLLLQAPLPTQQLPP